LELSLPLPLTAILDGGEPQYVVLVDIAKVDELWKAAGFPDYIDVDGQIRFTDEPLDRFRETHVHFQRYEIVKSLLTDGESELWMPELSVEEPGQMIVSHGQHRLAVLRDLGYKTVPALAYPFEEGSVETLRQLCGAAEEDGLITWQR
jgi:hypothetical protein